MRFSKQVCERYEHQQLTTEEKKAFEHELATNPYFVIAYKGYRRLQKGRVQAPGTGNPVHKRSAKKRTSRIKYRSIVWVVITASIILIVIVIYRQQQPAKPKNIQPIVPVQAKNQIPAIPLPDTSQHLQATPSASDSFSIGFPNPKHPGKTNMYTVSRRVWDSVSHDKNKKALELFIRELKKTPPNKD